MAGKVETVVLAILEQMLLSIEDHEILRHGHGTKKSRGMFKNN
jgi:hypothetical protein